MEVYLITKPKCKVWKPNLFSSRAKAINFLESEGYIVDDNFSDSLAPYKTQDCVLVGWIYTIEVK